MNKSLTRLFIGCICVVCLVFTANAQRKKTTTKKPVAKTTTTTTTTNALEIKDGAEKVSIQIKNLTKFIFVLGGVARGIEDTDKEAKTGKLSKNVVDKNTEFKQTVVTSIRNFRAGLAALEVEFRTKPGLKNYLFQIQGITDLSGRAEDLAIGGQFTESGKVLLLVVEKLSDTLAALP